ncbi:hypothetical protein AACH06_26950 [Ideonella sp. DXS29W]|uniref:Uncharacterized protein n=1 Tax=Ideonella lacteola TaxID=2984193 RepID=A0ABU9BZD6_9BURK
MLKAVVDDEEDDEDDEEGRSRRRKKKSAGGCGGGAEGDGCDEMEQMKEEILAECRTWLMSQLQLLRER